MSVFKLETHIPPSPIIEFTTTCVSLYFFETTPKH